MSLAKATVSGVVIADPEKRFTPNNTAVTNFAIQMAPAGGKNDGPFIVRVTCWRNLAEVAATGLQKGMEVTIDGRLQVNQYEAPGGTTKRTYEIDASHIFIGQLTPLTPAAQGGEASAWSPQQPAQPAYAAQQATPNMGFQPQQPVGVSVPQTAPAWAPPQQSFTPDDMVTEDDIPF